MKYRKRPALTEATQWFTNGDHPEDDTETITTGATRRLTEGKVVKFFRSTNIPGGRFCTICGNVMQNHGMLDGDNAVNREELVCPGDYIVTHANGKYYRLHPDEFETLYEPYIPTAQDRGLAG